MKLLSICLLLLFTFGCSTVQTTVVRERSTDPELRIFLADTVDMNNYVQIRRALVQSGKFEVVDRGNGMKAALMEQERQHGLAAYRFSDKEKWAWIGQFYGAAAVVLPHASCYQAKSWYGQFRRYCKQDLAFIEVNTGKILFEVSGENSEEWVVEYTAPDWDNTVGALVKSYPKYYEARVVQYPLNQYMDQSVERSKREQERREPAQMPPAKPEKSEDPLDALGPSEGPDAPQEIGIPKTIDTVKIRTTSMPAGVFTKKTVKQEKGE